MKYSLRSLMIVVTLACVVVGGRIEYLRQMAAYHEGELASFRQRMATAWDVPEDKIVTCMDKLARFKERRSYLVSSHGVSFQTKTNKGNSSEFTITSDWNVAFEHQRLAGVYRNADSRPWLFVNENP